MKSLVDIEGSYDYEIELLQVAEKCTELQKAFAEAYVGPARWNSFEAARLAGFAKSSIVQMANYCLNAPHVRAYILLLLRHAGRDTLVSSRRVVQELSAIAYSDITDVMDIDSAGVVTLKSGSLSDLPEPVRVAIKKIKVRGSAEAQTVEIEFHDKMKALQMLGAMGVEAEEAAERKEQGFTGLEIIAPPLPG